MMIAIVKMIELGSLLLKSLRVLDLNILKIMTILILLSEFQEYPELGQNSIPQSLFQTLGW